MCARSCVLSTLSKNEGVTLKTILDNNKCEIMQRERLSPRASFGSEGLPPLSRNDSEEFLSQYVKQRQARDKYTKEWIEIREIIQETGSKNSTKTSASEKKINHQHRPRYVQCLLCLMFPKNQGPWSYVCVLCFLFFFLFFFFYFQICEKERKGEEATTDVQSFYFEQRSRGFKVYAL
jgi:hypothetical protein